VLLSRAAAHHGWFNDGELNEEFTWLRDVQTGGWVLAYTLVGVALGHRSGWRVAKTLAQLVTLWLLWILVWGLALRQYIPPPSPTMQGWREIAVVSSIAPG
jgi:hypothetical protein